MASKTILLVDDDVDFLVTHQAALEAAGFEVLIAHDSREAMAVVETRSIDGAVLDVMMKTRDEGFRLARSLRKAPRTRAVPLVMLSSVNAVTASDGHPLNLSDADRDEMWLPVDRFLDKPVAPGDLVALLHELVG
jgi:CheY-like chemotaxis protein